MDNITYAVSQKSDGNLSFRHGDKEEVITNRKNFLKKHGLSLEDCVVMACEHEDNITIVDRSHRGRGSLDGESAIPTEAFITKEKGLTLFLLTADCLPVAYYDPIKGVIALAHLGWKPTGLLLASKVVKSMQNSFDNKPKDIQVFIAPGIHKESYGVKDAKQKGLPEWKEFIEDAGDSETKIDLIGFNKDQLLKSGIPEENISMDSSDTATSDKYFSHYRSNRTQEKDGRFATTICLNG